MPFRNITFMVGTINASKRSQGKNLSPTGTPPHGEGAQPRRWTGDADKPLTRHEGLTLRALSQLRGAIRHLQGGHLPPSGDFDTDRMSPVACARAPSRGVEGRCCAYRGALSTTKPARRPRTCRFVPTVSPPRRVGPVRDSRSANVTVFNRRPRARLLSNERRPHG